MKIDLIRWLPQNQLAIRVSFNAWESTTYTIHLISSTRTSYVDLLGITKLYPYDQKTNWRKSSQILLQDFVATDIDEYMVNLYLSIKENVKNEEEFLNYIELI